MKYLISLRTHPGMLKSCAEILSIRNTCSSAGISGVFPLSDEDVSDIDADTLTDEISSGRIMESDFEAFCDSIKQPLRCSDGRYNPNAATTFLELSFGQEILSLALKPDESTERIYGALVAFARKNGLRLWSPMPKVGEIDLDKPGRLPPCWNQLYPGSNG